MSTTSTFAYKEDKHKGGYRSGFAEVIYAMGFAGALAYFLGHSTTFLIGLLGFLKALAWPAVLIFELLKFLQL